MSFRAIHRDVDIVTHQDRSILRTVLKLGYVCFLFRRFEAAVTVSKRALKGCGISWGPDQPSTLVVIQHLDYAYGQASMHDKVEAVCQWGLEGLYRHGLGKVHGPEDLLFMSLLRHLGNPSFSENELQEAEAIYLNHCNVVEDTMV